MAITRSKSAITPGQTKRLLKKNKLREFQVNLDRLSTGLYPLTLNHILFFSIAGKILIIRDLFIRFDTDDAVFRKVLLEKHGIRDCFVRLDCLDVSEIPKLSPKKMFLLAPQNKSARLNVSWLHNQSSSQQNSEALSSLAVYQVQNDVVPPVAHKNVRRERAKSMFVDNPTTKQTTMDDMHLELHTKFGSPNRGLKSANNRQLGERKPEPLSEWQKLQEEFKKKVEAIKAKK